MLIPLLLFITFAIASPVKTTLNPNNGHIQPTSLPTLSPLPTPAPSLENKTRQERRYATGSHGMPAGYFDIHHHTNIPRETRAPVATGKPSTPHPQRDAEVGDVRKREALRPRGNYRHRSGHAYRPPPP